MFFRCSCSNFRVQSNEKAVKKCQEKDVKKAARRGAKSYAEKMHYIMICVLCVTFSLRLCVMPFLQKLININFIHLGKIYRFVPERKNINNAACPFCNTPYAGIFQELAPQDLEKLSANQSCELYKKGQVIIHEGARPNGIFFIHKGKVKIYKQGDGREQIIQISKEGDLLGYRALLAEEQYPVSAKTLEDCHICFVPKKVFLDTLFSSASFSQKVLREACRELDTMTGVLTNMAQKTVRERVSHTLLQLSDIYGENAINLKREDIAGLVGTATETLIRFLSELKDEKLIEIQGRKIVVKDKQGLKKFGRIFN